MRIRAALVETAGGPFTLRDLELEAPRADEVLIRVTAAGICHTDLSMRQRWPARISPMVFGHEGAGVVEAVGGGVTTVTVGDMVAVSYRSCGLCELCRSGHPAYCLLSDLNMRGTRADGSTPLTSGETKVFGNFFGQSSFATHLLAYQSNVVRVPATLSPTVAAPLGCSVQTGAGTVLNVLRPSPGDTVVVFGSGSVGLSAVMAAVSLGCEVIAVDPIAARRELAAELGATGTEPKAAHHAIDTTGRPDVIAQALGLLRRRGTLALVGLGGKAEFDIRTVMYNGLRIRGVIEGDASPATFLPQLVDLHRLGRLPVERLITEYPFEDIESAARDAASGKVVKPVLTFG
ncbi:zinc-binding alcohol dehydrogenase [Actinoplanes philippinensis]|uniref:Aryl-alcohol dehydrogenase n=1 Tax=Actinoplanes philippinensis TaxID=35752 RepID=A0A1I2NB47_9ACTN|nr:NAD(P)-dependent alcohol dehydrogenase [Actinoplanes philippinensis]GIE83446.1 zinc-binding alcohol dehydrogenase [Actinoplanes philippinensis]SFG00300.1 aryl-alcohol dehydrogenase [Actinoplanes philippinensis]